MPQTKKDSLTKWLDRTPPFLVYFIARNRGMKLAQIAAAANISSRFVTRLAGRVTWNRVRVGVMQQFCSACGVRPWVYEERRYKFIRSLVTTTKDGFSRLDPRERKSLNRCCQRWMAVKQG